MASGLGLLHVTLVVAYARLWRLLVHHFRQYAWRLAQACDPASTDEQRQNVIEEFLRIPKESAKREPGLGRRLRGMVDTVQD
eukprot:245787-Karenia_brevis.AAC.1